MIKTVKKWTIAAATMAALSVGGYSVVDWTDDGGFVIVDTVNVGTSRMIDSLGDTVTIQRDTITFKDSTALAGFATLNEFRLGVNTLK